MCGGRGVRVFWVANYTRGFRTPMCAPHRAWGPCLDILGANVNLWGIYAKITKIAGFRGRLATQGARLHFFSRKSFLAPLNPRISRCAPPLGARGPMAPDQREPVSNDPPRRPGGRVADQCADAANRAQRSLPLSRNRCSCHRCPCTTAAPGYVMPSAVPRRRARLPGKEGPPPGAHCLVSV